MKVVYIAGPFRGRNAWAVHRNVEAAKAWILPIAELGLVPLSPHCLYSDFDGTMTDRFWLDATMDLLRKCDGIFMMPSWRKSTGAKAELAEASRRGLPAFFSLASLLRWVTGSGSIRVMLGPKRTKISPTRRPTKPSSRASGSTTRTSSPRSGKRTSKPARRSTKKPPSPTPANGASGPELCKHGNPKHLCRGVLHLNETFGHGGSVPMPRDYVYKDPTLVVEEYL